MNDRPQTESAAATSVGRTYAPLLVGIIGKRDLQGHDEAVRTAISTALGIIERDFPHSPKVLVSALAEGADTLGAEEALHRGWQVAAPLPFDIELYAEDFEGAAEARLRTLAARARTFALPPLTDPRTGAPFTADALSRRHDPNPHRADHYEQVGLYIAEVCTLLIAVLPASERPGRIGGTARIIEARQHGAFDAKCRDVTERSSVLHAGSPLDPPAGGPIWLIDLATIAQRKGEKQPFEVLLAPAQVEDARASRARKLHTSLRLFDRLEDFNRRVTALPDQLWQDQVVKRAGGRPEDAAAVLLRLRHALSLIQGTAKTAVSRTIVALAVLFVAAILSFECYVAMPHTWAGIALLINLVTVAAALSLYVFARVRRWSSYSEDYRAGAEALRVQLAWWDAGLRTAADRVDRIFMRGAIGSRTVVRAAIRSLVNGALLLAGPPQAPANLQSVEREWVGLPDRDGAPMKGQVDYFARRVKSRHAAVARIGLTSWAMFMAALGMAVFLLLAHSGNDEALRARMRTITDVFSLLSLVAAGALLIWGASERWGAGDALALARRRYVLAAYWGFLFGLLGAAALFTALGILHYSDHHEWRLHVIIVLSVVTTAAAGALRFVAEKLSWEAEGRSYMEALALFRYAARRLKAARDDTGRPQADRDAERGEIIRALGYEALKENEAWVRAHRERPLEPMIGG